MYSPCGTAVLPAVGFPIRASTDHCLFSGSPWLFAAVHALHRLLVPRHPPCALDILTVISTVTTRLTRPKAELVTSSIGDTRCVDSLCSFQGPPRERAGFPPAGLSKLNSVRAHRVPADHPGGRLVRPAHVRPSRTRSTLGNRSSVSSGAEWRRSALETAAPILELPRKEVIQPHLPVRLPCYDFTPVTSPTFDGSLPEGLGHRLRVLPASVV